ncbi:MAG: tandem-95 repeat protein, partial [candidate division Zixibacteria bacterium]|nr:tandem-95 repeat protein [candidate division Zixibacteria bacterium]
AGSLTFSPNFTQSGIYNVSFIASDGALADTQFVAITVNQINLKPVLASIGAQTVDEGQILAFRVSATDPDATIPVLMALSLPPNASIVDSLNGAGSLRFTPDFTQAGVYNVSFVAFDGALADTQIVAITVNNVNRKPVITPIGAQTIAENQTLNLRVLSSDPDGTIPTLAVLGLPLNAVFADSLNGAGGFTFTPDNSQSGIYNVRFVASDGGLADTITVQITVNNTNLKPALAVPGPQSVNEGLALAFRVSGTDPDATIPSLSALNLPANATFFDSLNGAGSLSFSPDFTQAGIYNVSFVASDGALADTQLVAITVNDVNRKPLLTVPGPQTVNEGLALAFRVSASDPDGTISVLSTTGVPLNATFVDSLNGAGSLSFSPDFAQAGAYTITLVASDGALADTQSVAITVNNVNQKPILFPIGAKALTEGQILTFRVSATDGDGTIPSLSATGLPINATFVDSANGAGSFRFAPDFAQSGAYAVKFFASDGSLTDSITVSVTVYNFGTNAEPVITPIPDTLVNEGDSLIVGITVIDSDGGSISPDISVSTTLKNYTFSEHLNGTGTLTYRPTYLNAGKDTVRVFATDYGSPRMTSSLTFVVTTNDVNRPPTWAPVGPFSFSVGQTLSFVVAAKDSTDPITSHRLFLSAMNAPANSNFVDSANGHGLFTFVPTSTQVGVDTVNFLAVDQGGPPLSAILSVIITVKQANRPPVLTYIGPKVVTEGQVLGFRVSATDPDGGIPRLFTDSLPRNATFIDSLNGAGSFRFVPSFVQAGLYSVTFKATDGISVAKQVVFIQVYEAGNQKPVFDSLPVITVVEADSVTKVITAQDPDGSPVTVSADTSTVPTFATVTGGTGQITIKAKPSFKDNGNYLITLIASDGVRADTSVILMIVIDAGNQPPILAAIGSKQVMELQNIAFRISATDADGSFPILSVDPLPTGAVFRDSLNGAGSFRWTP